MKKSKKVVVSFIAFLLVVFTFGIHKESELPGVSVPITAKVNEVKMLSASYDYKGINTLYELQLKWRGWKEVDRMGSMVFLMKDERKIGLTTYKDGFDLIEWSN